MFANISPPVSWSRILGYMRFRSVQPPRWFNFGGSTYLSNFGSFNGSPIWMNASYVAPGYGCCHHASLAGLICDPSQALGPEAKAEMEAHCDSLSGTQ